MSEIAQLKNRIDLSGFDGVETDKIRDDYEPAGNMMIQNLTASKEYVSRKGYGDSLDQKWRIFKLEFTPY